MENKKNLSELETEEIDYYFTKLVRILNKKEEHGYHDRNDLDYYGIRDTENLFSKVDEEDYCKPISVKSSFKRSYKYHKSRGDRNKNLSAKQYLYKIIQHSHDMIIDHKPNNKNLKYGKFKYLCIYILFLLEILEKIALFMYGVIIKVSCGVRRQIILLEDFSNLF